jgi:hypothetical protein
MTERIIYHKVKGKRVMSLIETQTATIICDRTKKSFEGEVRYKGKESGGPEVLRDGVWWSVNGRFDGEGTVFTVHDWRYEVWSPSEREEK